MPSSNGVSAGPMITAFLYDQEALVERLMQSKFMRVMPLYSGLACGDSSISIPGHDVVCDGAGADSGRWIGLHAFEIAHQPPPRRRRHLDLVSRASNKVKLFL